MKVLMDQITTTKESNLKQLEHILKTYNIKMKVPGEDIDEVVANFRAIFETINTLRGQEGLPTNSISDLLKIFQTTTVEVFKWYIQGTGK